MEPDILYVVRYGEKNAALRYSLRSLSNLPHRRVFIAGYCPNWVRGVTAVEVPRRSSKFDSIEENVRCGVLHPEMGDEVVYMNDDFYVTRPVDQIPVTHSGPVDQYQGQQELKIRMRQTIRLFVNHGYFVQFQGMLSYDGIHMPLPLERDAARAILATCPKGVLWRTWYGNIHAIGGEQVPDAKYRGAYPVPTVLPTFLSTNSHGLRVLREQLDDILPEECPYV